MAMLRRRVVLFDFDGVVSDTENVHVAAWERTFAAMGWDVSPETCARGGHEDDRAFLATVFAARAVENADLDGWVARKQALTRAMIDASPRVYPGVAELFRALHELGVKLGIVTATWRSNVETALERSGLAGLVATIVTKEDVASAEPDPEGYLLACKRLRVRPGAAVALEASPSGVTAATVAGLAVLAVGHRRPQGEWSLGAPFVDDLRNTQAIVGQLGLST
jgi:sugar-phosphatase